MQALARFERIYRENFAFVWAAARRCGAPAPAFDGLVRDVFVTAFQRRDELPYEISERAWLYGITRRAFDKVRAVSKGAGRPARDGAARQLDDVMGPLGEQTRHVLVMAELLEMTAPEIASELQLPVPEVRRRLSKAREFLAREMSEARADRALAAVRREDQPPNKAMHDVWTAIGPTLQKVGTAYGEPTPWTTRLFFGAAAVALGFVGIAVIGSLEFGSDNEEEIEDLTAQAGKSKVAGASVGPGPDPGRLFGKIDATEERTLLEEATEALKTDRPSAALRKLERHGTVFPNSPLSQQRESMRARALCRLGRQDEGRQVAAAVLASDPASTDGAAAQAECSAAAAGAAPGAVGTPGTATPGAATPGAATPGAATTPTPGAAPAPGTAAPAGAATPATATPAAPATPAGTVPTTG